MIHVGGQDQRFGAFSNVDQNIPKIILPSFQPMFSRNSKDFLLDQVFVIGRGRAVL
jgi:hypothetical protein